MNVETYHAQMTKATMIMSLYSILNYYFFARLFSIQFSALSPSLSFNLEKLCFSIFGFSKGKAKVFTKSVFFCTCSN